MKNLILNNSQKLTSELFFKLSKDCNSFRVDRFNLLLDKFSIVLITENFKTFENFINSDICFIENKSLQSMDISTYTNLIEHDEYLSFELIFRNNKKESFILKATKY